MGELLSQIERAALSENRTPCSAGPPASQAAVPNASKNRSIEASKHRSMELELGALALGAALFSGLRPLTGFPRASNSQPLPTVDDFMSGATSHLRAQPSTLCCAQVSLSRAWAAYRRLPGSPAQQATEHSKSPQPASCQQKFHVQLNQPLPGVTTSGELRNWKALSALARSWCLHVLHLASQTQIF